MRICAIVVAEKKLERKLKDDEVVHHLDKNRSNNNPDNLIVFINTSEHTAFHRGCNIIGYKDGSAYCDRKINKCPICGKKIDNKSKLCIECHNNERRKLKIDKDALYNLLLNNSFSKVGKMFGITDNAIRRYCKKFNIPYKSSDYKKIKKRNVANEYII
jgi:hypothetical protein